MEYLQCVWHAAPQFTTTIILSGLCTVCNEKRCLAINVVDEINRFSQGESKQVPTNNPFLLI